MKLPCEREKVGKIIANNVTAQNIVAVKFKAKKCDEYMFRDKARFRDIVYHWFKYCRDRFTMNCLKRASEKFWKRISVGNRILQFTLRKLFLRHWKRYQVGSQIVSLLSEAHTVIQYHFYSSASFVDIMIVETSGSAVNIRREFSLKQ